MVTILFQLYSKFSLTCPPNIGPGVVLKFSWTKGVGYGQETLHTGADHHDASRSSQGAKMADVCRKLGISAQTFCRWRKEYGGMRVDQAKRLKELEKENIRLKKLVADLLLDNAILKEANRGNF